MPLIDLANLDGSNGFRFDGAAASDYAGRSVSAAGDVNGDGFGDLLIGADFADAGALNSGEVYVVFGKANSFTASINPGDLDGADGFRLEGVAAGNLAGRALDGAGDVNGDGFDDIVIGAPFASPPGAVSGGEAYVVFGAGAFGTAASLAALDGTDGVTIRGSALSNLTGSGVGGMGDIDGDGFADVGIGSPNARPYSYANILFGVDGASKAFYDTTELNSIGTGLYGPYNSIGHSVGGGGDFNGDGFVDADLSSPRTEEFIFGGRTGSADLVFGPTFAPDRNFVRELFLENLPEEDRVRLVGADNYDETGHVSESLGDINGDGFDDLFIGAPGISAAGDRAGGGYVIFGKPPNFYTLPFDLETLDASEGFRIEGSAPGDRLGVSGGPAGDFNGDGLADILIGASGADTPGGDDTGSAFLLFGRSEAGFTDARFQNIRVDQFLPGDGLRIEGLGAGDELGYDVDTAGDVNKVP